VYGQFRTMRAVALAVGLLAALAATARAGDLDEAVLAEVNFARAHPQDYARALMLLPVSEWERSLGASTTAQDPGAYAEAIAFLMQQAPLPPLQPDEHLAEAASEHLDAQGPSGQTGHNGADGERFDHRLRRHGVRADYLGENIAYGPSRASDVVRELIIDSGVLSRGHRRNLFHPVFGAAGVRCGPHRDYAAMCVMDFASPLATAAPWRQADASR
jgi:uncharacterized protein YkwD